MLYVQRFQCLTRNVFAFYTTENKSRLQLDADFWDRWHEIQWFSKEVDNVKLEMRDYSYRVFGSNKTTNAGWKFEPAFPKTLNENESNAFYIKSKRWSDYYMKMKVNGTCVAVQKKPKAGGIWTLIEQGNTDEKIYLIKVMNDSGRYLYLESNEEEVRGKRNSDKFLKKGLWKLLPLPN